MSHTFTGVFQCKWIESYATFSVLFLANAKPPGGSIILLTFIVLVMNIGCFARMCMSKQATFINKTLHLFALYTLELGMPNKDFYDCI